MHFQSVYIYNPLKWQVHIKDLIPRGKNNQKTKKRKDSQLSRGGHSGGLDDETHHALFLSQI